MTGHVVVEFGRVDVEVETVVAAAVRAGVEPARAPQRCHFLGARCYPPLRQQRAETLGDTRDAEFARHDVPGASAGTAHSTSWRRSRSARARGTIGWMCPSAAGVVISTRMPGSPPRARAGQARSAMGGPIARCRRRNPNTAR